MTAGKREKQHKRMGGFPGDPTVQNHLATQGTWVPSLVRELRSLTGVTATEPMLRNKTAPGAATREKPACQHSQKEKEKKE